MSRFNINPEFFEKTYKRLFMNKFLNRWYVLLVDLITILVAANLAYLFTSELYEYVNGPIFGPWYLIVLLSVLINLIFFFIFRTFGGVIRYSTIYEVQKIFISLIISDVFLFLVLILFVADLTITSVLIYCVVFLLVSIVGLFFFRAIVVTSFNSLRQRYEGVSRVYLWGLTENNISAAQMLKGLRNTYQIRGFINTKDSNKKLKANTQLPIREISFLEQVRNPRNILFLNDADFQKNKKEVEEILKLGHRIFIMKDININNVKDIEEIPKNIHQVQIEDLLGREEITINRERISSNIQGKIVIVSGAAGSIGSEIVRQVAKFHPNKIICIDQAETPLNELSLELSNHEALNFECMLCDIRKKDKLESIFAEHNPDIVYHAGAYKHVPMMEKEPEEAIITNVKGSKNMADLSLKYEAEMFVMISTDKAVNPTNIMGASKRIAEIYVQTLALQNKDKKTKFVTTRFGNVLGSNGSVIPLFKTQIANGGPVTVTHKDITRYFMTIPEACRLVLEASFIGESGYIYVFDMGEPVKIYDLAQKMIELSGFTVGKDIEIKITGLRAGEKLYEELLSDSEITEETSNVKIKIAKVRSYDATYVYSSIDELIEMAGKKDIDNLVRGMKKLVPEFVSKNSRFSSLDSEN